MKATEIRSKSVDELRTLATTLREELFRARMLHYTGQLEKPSRLGELRKDIARVETVLTERAVAG